MYNPEKRQILGNSNPSTHDDPLKEIRANPGYVCVSNGLPRVTSATLPASKPVNETRNFIVADKLTQKQMIKTRYYRVVESVHDHGMRKHFVDNDNNRTSKPKYYNEYGMNLRILDGQVYIGDYAPYMYELPAIEAYETWLDESIVKELQTMKTIYSVTLECRDNGNYLVVVGRDSTTARFRMSIKQRPIRQDNDVVERVEHMPALSSGDKITYFDRVTDKLYS